MLIMDSSGVGDRFDADGDDDNDGVVRLLAFIWRYRIAVILILGTSSLLSVLFHEAALPFRTTMSLRLVSPCIAYRHHDFWNPSSAAWRSQLNAVASKHQSRDLKVVVNAGQEPWLLTVTAEHEQNDEIEHLLRSLVIETETQLGVTESFGGVRETSGAGEEVVNISSSNLMLSLRRTLEKLDRLLGERRETEWPAHEHPVNSFPHISGTLSPVPIESVPYYPWFQRLQVAACEALSSAVSGSDQPQLPEEQLRQIAGHLEHAASLMTQVWFSLDPLNPVGQIPEARVQSVSGGSNRQRSMVQVVGIGLWSGLFGILLLASVTLWFSAHAPKIAALSAVNDIAGSR